MNDIDYKPNSHKYRENQEEVPNEKREVKKVVSKPVQTKKNEIRRLADIFISEDVSNVKSYIWMDVLVPTIKKAIVDIVTDGVNMIFFGGTGARNKINSNTSKISYRNFYDQKDTPIYSQASSTAKFNYDDIIFETRGEAEAVREEMDNVIERYGFVTIADMYDMVELTPPFTSNKYGWSNISSSRVIKTRYGYVIDLPKAKPIER